MLNQWGQANDISKGTAIILPIEFSKNVYSITCNGRENANRDAIQVFSVHSKTKQSFKVLSWRIDGLVTNDFVEYIAVGF